MVDPLWWSVPLEEHEEDETDIPQEVRMEVLNRDRWMCMHCGTNDTEALTLHHVTYRSQGGKHNPDNLVTLCWTCHRKIHDGNLDVIRTNNSWFFKLSYRRKAWLTAKKTYP